MQRIKTSTAATEKPAYSATGTPGYFRVGNAVADIPATVMGQDWPNMIQEEMAHVILAAGLELLAEDDTQLNQAIDIKIAAAVPDIAAATEEAAGIARIATSAEVAAGTDDETIVTPAKLAAALGGSAVDVFYIDAGSLLPALVDGAIPGAAEDSTNHLARNVMRFPGTKDTHAFANFCLPDNWDGGTIKAKVLWKGATGCSAADNVRFYLAGAAVSDAEALDLALGTAVNLDDTVNTGAGYLNMTAASGELTFAGSPLAGDLLRLRLSRDYDYGASPMSEEAEVLGLVLQYGITGNIAAW